MSKSNPTIKIEPELESFLPHLDKDTKELLEKSIVETGGPTEPIVVWKGKDILVDGHNRYEIATKLNLPFEIEQKDFTDMREVKLFMLQRQLSRRNLTEFMLKNLRGNYYKMLKQDPAENLRKSKTKAAKAAAPKGQTGTPKKSTAKTVADKFGTSERTVKRDATFTSGVDAIRETKGKEMADAVLAGTTKVRKQDVEAIGRAKTKKTREAAIEKALDPKTRAPKPKAKAKVEPEAPAPEVLPTGNGQVWAVAKAARLLFVGQTAATRRAALGTLAKELGTLDDKTYKVPGEFVGGKAQDEPSEPQDASVEVRGVGAGAKSKPDPKPEPKQETPEMPEFLKRKKAAS